MVINLAPIQIAVERVIIRHELELLDEQIKRETEGWPKYQALAFWFSRMAVYVAQVKERIRAIGDDPANIMGRVIH